MLAAAGKGNRIVTLDILAHAGDTRNWRSNWNAGSGTDATSACLSAGRKVFRLPVKATAEQSWSLSPAGPAAPAGACADGGESVPRLGITANHPYLGRTAVPV